MKYLNKLQKDIIKNPSLDLGIEIHKRWKDFEATIDTGFTGFLCINLELALMLGFKPTGKMPVVNADGKVSYDNTFGITVQFGSLDLEKTKYTILAIGKKNQKEEVMIGQALLNHFCLQNSLKLSFDYPENQIYFEKS
jgi:predicted aspartyl protease